MIDCAWFCVCVCYEILQGVKINKWDHSQLFGCAPYRTIFAISSLVPTSTFTALSSCRGFRLVNKISVSEKVMQRRLEENDVPVFECFVDSQQQSWISTSARAQKRSRPRGRIQ